MTFVIMFIVSFLAGSLADRLKRMAGQSERNRYRTQILYDTSQLLNKALVSQEAAEVLGVQLHKLLDRDTVVACIDEEGKIACRYYPDTCRSTFEGQADQDALVWSVRSRRPSIPAPAAATLRFIREVIRMGRSVFCRAMPDSMSSRKAS